MQYYVVKQIFAVSCDRCLDKCLLVNSAPRVKSLSCSSVKAKGCTFAVIEFRFSIASKSRVSRLTGLKHVRSIPMSCGNLKAAVSLRRWTHCSPRLNSPPTPAHVSSSTHMSLAPSQAASPRTNVTSPGLTTQAPLPEVEAVQEILMTMKSALSALGVSY